MSEVKKLIELLSKVGVASAVDHKGIHEEYLKMSQLLESINDKFLLRAIFLAGGPGSGKCLGKGTEVLMFDGSLKKAEDIKEGDALMGDDSKKRIVKATHAGKAPMFKITPIKGDPFVCSGEHLLTIKKSSRRRKNGKNVRFYKTIDISVNSFLKQSKRFKERAKLFRVPLAFEAKEVPLDPYFFGLWLGDGDAHRSGVTTTEPEIVSVLNNVAEEYERVELKKCVGSSHGMASAYHLSTGRDGFHDNPILNVLRSLGVVKNKHIPKVFKNNSREIRLELLAGLIDIDGSISNKCCEITQKRECLLDDIVFLARSLGFAAYKSEKEINGETYYRAFISGEVSQIPCRVKRKQCDARKQIKSVLHTGFTVEPLGEDAFYGFEIDGNHRHLLGDFTVTHNSFIANLFFGGGKKSVVKGLPVMFVNSDTAFEFLLARDKLPFDIHKNETAIGKKQFQARNIAKRMTRNRFLSWIDGLLPIVVDGTGKSYEKISTQAENLRSIGYDVSMIFVNTSLDVALKRNNMRKRVVPDEIVVKAWNQVQGNLGKFQSFFGGHNFHVIDNNTVLTGSDLKTFEKDLFVRGMKLLQRPLKNNIGNEMIDYLRGTGGKYMHDLDPKFADRIRHLFP